MALPRFPEITGPYPKFAEKVRQITGPVARETAAMRGDVSHDTIANMWRGERVSRHTVLRFAAGYRIDPNPLLELLGHAAVTDSKALARLPVDELVALTAQELGLDSRLLFSLQEAAQEDTQKRNSQTLKSVQIVLDRRIQPVELENWEMDSKFLYEQNERQRAHLLALQSGAKKRVEGHSRKRRPKQTESSSATPLSDSPSSPLVDEARDRVTI